MILKFKEPMYNFVVNVLDRCIYSDAVLPQLHVDDLA